MGMSESAPPWDPVELLDHNHGKGLCVHHRVLGYGFENFANCAVAPRLKLGVRVTDRLRASARGKRRITAYPKLSRHSAFDELKQHETNTGVNTAYSIAAPAASLLYHG